MSASSSSRTSSSSLRPAPYPKCNAAKQDRSKFLEIDSTIMPRPIPAWSRASKLVSRDFDQNQRARPGVPRGYFLPEPGLFAGSQDLNAQNAYISMYLKLRDVLLHHIRSLSMVGCLKTHAEWRKIIGLERHTGEYMCNKLVAELQTSLNDSTLSLDLSNLANIMPHWKGQPLAGVVPDNICCEILLEICTVSFKNEFLLADHFLYVLQPEGFKEQESGQVMNDLDALLCEGRMVKVMDAIPGFYEGCELELGLTDPTKCQRSWYALFHVMSGWTRVLKMAGESEQLLGKLAGPVSPAALDTAEYHGAFFYIASFAEFFKPTTTTTNPTTTSLKALILHILSSLCRSWEFSSVAFADLSDSTTTTTTNPTTTSLKALILHILSSLCRSWEICRVDFGAN
ncbi:hypothetical protein BT96DRAFT_1025289 [Gymnopus androsaceus JB14]|uniref:Uncharacterized protein n=1 Tax=Gymnopus androsaceus JB14 TaxID=1447944 RepID=A0A6A4GSS6_9AGAR|nr:hypothetical protein BT96DRAFT_1025289 [Gymnopus androsaceus JB14]